MHEKSWQTGRFDWNQARSFLVTAEQGSLSAAARALGLTQPTPGRQVAALEESLGVTLFERVGRSLSLTEAGMDLLTHVKAMCSAAEQVSLAATGQSQTIEGHVVITASDLMSAYHLPPLEKLRDLAPGIMSKSSPQTRSGSEAPRSGYRHPPCSTDTTGSYR